MNKKYKMITIGLLVLNVFVWSGILWEGFGKRLELYFFAVGQGDGEMAILPGNVKMVIDGGPPNGKAAQWLGEVLPWHDRYIDMIVLSHAEQDHFGGLADIIQRYKVGVFVYNGIGNSSEGFKELAAMVKEKNIPVVIVREGDRITHGDSKWEILSASGKDRNEGALVMRLESKGTTALFTGDIGAETEKRLIKEKHIQADILKVPHHGSRFSSTAEFLAAVRPRVAVVEVGKNSYGHPTKEVLERIRAAKAQLFRTDTSGTIKFVIENGTIAFEKL